MSRRHSIVFWLHEIPVISASVVAMNTDGICAQPLHRIKNNLLVFCFVGGSNSGNRVTLERHMILAGFMASSLLKASTTAPPVSSNIKIFLPKRYEATLTALRLFMFALVLSLPSSVIQRSSKLHLHTIPLGGAYLTLDLSGVATDLKRKNVFCMKTGHCV